MVKVYDGDTITVAGYLKGDPECYKFKVRLNGIDSPELKVLVKMKKNRIISRNALSDKILNNIVTLDIKGTEKYGRFIRCII